MVFSKPRFGPLAVNSSSAASSTSGNSAASSIASRLKDANSKEHTVEIITEGLVGKVAGILQMPPSEVDPECPMYRYGVNSLVGLKVRNWISEEMKSSVALFEVLAAVPMKVFGATIAEKSKLLASGEA